MEFLAIALLMLTILRIGALANDHGKMEPPAGRTSRKRLVCCRTPSVL